MAGVVIKIDADGESAVMQALHRLSGFEETQQRLFDTIGQTIVSNIRNRWTQGEGLEGKWRLSGRVKREGGTTLRKTSRLMDSITHNVLQSGVEIGTDVIYGAIHHFGGEIRHEARMRRTYFRQGRDGTVGNRFVRKSVLTSCRNLWVRLISSICQPSILGLTEQDEQDVLNDIVEHLTDER